MASAFGHGVGVILEQHFVQEIAVKILYFQNKVLLCQGAFRLLLNMCYADETEDLYADLEHQHRLS